MGSVLIPTVQPSRLLCFHPPAGKIHPRWGQSSHDPRTSALSRSFESRTIMNHLRQVDMILNVEIRMLKCKEKISTSFGCTFAVIYIQWNQRCAWKLGSKTPALRLEHPGAPRRKNDALRLWQEIPEDDMTGILPSTHPTLKFESSQSHSPCRFLISVTDVFIVPKTTYQTSAELSILSTFVNNYEL